MFEDANKNMQQRTNKIAETLQKNSTRNEEQISQLEMVYVHSTCKLPPLGKISNAIGAADQRQKSYYKIILNAWYDDIL